MLVLLTISAAAVGMSVVIGEDNTTTAEITPESPEITLESMEAEAELLDNGDTAVLGFDCQICPTAMDCQAPENFRKTCQTIPDTCRCNWCNSALNCHVVHFPFP